MITGKIFTDDGELVFVQSSEDLIQLVKRKIGFEAAQLIQELVEIAKREAERHDSDLSSYERELDELLIKIREFERKPEMLTSISNKHRLSSADKYDLRRLAEMIRGLLSLT